LSAWLTLGTPFSCTALNLATMHCQLGEPERTRAALATVGQDMSGYGRMVQAQAQLCAAAQSGDHAAADAALAYLAEHRDDSPGGYLQGLLRLDRRDEAAREIIRQLQAPERDDALALFQTYREVAPLPGDVGPRRTLRAVIARADVQAAFRPVGHARTFPIYDTSGTD
jgi:hypothetical protein